jgi:plasmid stabilization system protein ParE
MEWLRRFLQNLFSRIARFFGPSEEERKIQELEQKLKSLEEEIRRIRTEWEREKKRKKKLEKLVRRLAKKNKKMREEIEGLKEEIERLKGYVPVQIRMRTHAQNEDEAEIIVFQVAREYARKMISDIEKLEQDKETEYVRTSDGAYWYFRVRTNPTGTEEPADPRWGTVLGWLIDLEVVIPEKPYVLVTTISSIAGWDIDIQRRKGGYVLTEKWEAGRNSGFAEISVRIGQTALEV